ncbi:MAG TPA: hypothetical protein VF085_12610 [Solirubrobacterales bacterium]
MPAKQIHRAIPVALIAFCAVALGASSALAADARYEGASADGKVAFFSTTEQLVSGDTDTRTDVYVRHFDAGVGEGGAFVTRIVSLGPTGGNNASNATFDGASTDGQRVFFSTRERLTAGDTDNFSDVYMRDLKAKATTLVSGGANGPFDANFVGMSGDGGRVFFSTREKLSGDDSDDSFDVYVRAIGAPGLIERVSQGATACAPACGNGAADASFLGASSDGTEVAFGSSEPLTGLPSAVQRIYLRDIGEPSSETTRLVSPSGTCPEGKTAKDCEPSFGGISVDGSHVFFETSAQVTGDDTDKAQDVYAWSGGSVTRASTGPDGGNVEANANALFSGSSPDGSAVYFETGEQLDPVADTDASQDIYGRDLGAGETTLVSRGEAACQPGCGNGGFNATVVRRDNVPNGVTVDGADTRVLFSTKEKLTSDDTDASFDIYARELPAGQTVRVSRGAAACEPGCGNGAPDASFTASSSDGLRAFFVTDESLDGEDLDSGAKDIYERNLETATTTRISRGDGSICASPPCDNGSKDAQLHGISADGTVAFFVSEERLTADADVSNDDKVYSRSGTTTRLISAGNPAGLQLGPPAPILAGTTPESPAASTSPKVFGSAEAESFIKLYETDDCSGEPVATGDAATLAEPGIGVAVESGVTTRFRATAEADGFVSPCSNEVSYRQRGEESLHSGAGGSSPVVDHGLGALPEPVLHREDAIQVPQTRITFGPAFKTRVRRPVFRFTDATGQVGTSFICELDRHRWHPCSSPTQLRKLAPGEHVFRVKGVNVDGVWEAKPTRRVFKLVRPAGERKHSRQSRRGRR